MTTNIEYIPLGGNCSIAYQLHKRGLRDNGYPFDWSKSTMNQLLSSLEDNLIKYVTSLEISDFSNNHPYIKFSGPPILGMNDNALLEQGTYKCRNDYGITMSHELVVKNDFLTLKEKLSRRVLRFLDLKNSNKDILNFIRLEMKVVSVECYIPKLINLINSLIEITGNKKIKLSLIFHTLNSSIVEYISTNKILKDLMTHNNIEIKYHFYNNFSNDWTMKHIDWNAVFMN
jgi:hypothetical protein